MKSTYDLYRSIWRREVQRQVSHGESKEGPVKSFPQTRYPNILAEIEASQYFFCTVRKHADITQEILWAVLEDGELLQDMEICKLTDLFECRFSYLKAPTLQVLDMNSNRGKFRRARLGQWLERIKPVPRDHCPDWDLIWSVDQAAKVYQAMERGEPVTFAAWRWAMGRCAYVIRQQRRAVKKPRSVRLA